MFTSSSFSISGEDGVEGEANDESEDELDDPWRSPSEKIAWVYFVNLSTSFSLSSVYPFIVLTSIRKILFQIVDNMYEFF